MKFELPKLPYAYGALEPYLDAETMRIHHDKHHQAYLDKFNAVMEKYPDLQDKTAEYLLANLNNLPVSSEDKAKIKNHGGGYLNHSLFWEMMSPQKNIDEALAEEIRAQFESVEEFKKKFNEVAAGHFASGWAHFVRDENNRLQAYSLPNQDSPLTLGHTPILMLDLWEHAYYLKYQNRRAEFIEAWWNAVKIV